MADDASRLTPVPERAVDAALAEFNTLRSEVAGYITAQSALVGITLTAFGVIFGLVLDKGDNSQIALTIPFLSLLVSLLYTAASYRLSRLGDYISATLWPYIQKQVDESLPSWERAKTQQQRQWQNVLIGGPLESAVTFLLVGSSVFALILGRASSSALFFAAIVATVLIAVVAAIPAVMEYRARPRNERQ